jgi:glycosyltransferase involved in cell wall biosynthesis
MKAGNQETDRSICIYSPVMMALGGIETHLINLACHLGASGWHVALCVKRSALTPFTEARLLSAGVRYHRFPELAFFRYAVFSSALLYTNSQGGSSPLVWRLSRRGRKGFHHCHTACSPSDTRHWAKSYLAFVRNGPPLVACSQTTARNLRELSPNREIHVMPYFAIGDQGGAPPESTSKQTTHTKKPVVNFGFIGRLEESKGIDFLIKASKRPELADIRWHIFGDGSLAEAVRAASGPNFLWHGSFDGATDLGAIYGRLDAVVLPSKHVEGSPLCLIEALAHGKPWVAFDQGGIRELVANSDDCVIAETSDFQGFLVAVLNLRARVLRNQIDQNSLFRHYESEFSPRAVAAKWDALVESIRKRT